MTQEPDAPQNAEQIAAEMMGEIDVGVPATVPPPTPKKAPRAPAKKKKRKVAKQGERTKLGALRKIKADSDAGMVAAMQNASKPLPTPPDYVRVLPAHMKFWDAIMRERSLDEWTPVHLSVAAQLARVQYDIECQSLALEVENAVVRGPLGAQVPNPRFKVLEAMVRRELSLMRMLRMGGVLNVGPARDEKHKREVEYRSRRIAEELKQEQQEEGGVAPATPAQGDDDDDLLA